MRPARPLRPPRRAGPRRRASVAAPLGTLFVALLVAGLAGPRGARPAAAADPLPLPFHRVHVPAGRIDEVPLGPDRLVPLPLGDFEEALRAAGAAADASAPPGLVPEARYRAVLGSDGRFDGTMTCDVDGAAGVSTIDLGGLPADGAAAAAADGPVPILLHGDADGRLAATLARPARCTFHWTLDRDGEGGWYELPLVPAARALVDLVLPAGLWPAVEGNRLVRQAESGASAAAGGETEGAAPTAMWRVEAGPVPALRFRLLPLREGTRSIACHQTATVGLGQIQLTATLVPAAPWRSRELVVEADPRLVVERVTAADADGAADRPDGRDATRLRIALPDEILGTTTPVTLRAAARAGSGEAAAEWLPLVWPEAPDWGSGGVRVACEAGLSLADVEIENAVAVDAGTAAGWAAPPAPLAGDPAAVALEAQGPGARVRVAVLPAAAELDVARVTTADVAAAGVTARAECDVRVKRGAAYDIGGRVAAGWFIDSVEALEEEGEGDPAARGPAAAALPVPIEWRVARDGRGAALRIGLPVAVTPRRGLRLRIAGHRAGVDFDVPFACRDLDMVRLEGEADDAAVLALSSPPETTIELDRAAPPPESPAPRLAALLSSAAVRAWIPADGGAMAGSALLLERRAAVEGSTAVVLTCRDDRIVQAFTFTCRPGSAPLDAVVVHFSEPTDDLLEWTLLPPAGAALSVRRVAERGGTARGGETWLVEFQPPLRRETGLRATRVVPFNGPVAVPLAWIEGSGREDGSLAVVNAGRRRPLFLNRRLAELPPGGVAAAGVLAEFAYDSDAADPAGTPAAELVPGGRDRDEDARAWAWGESSTCWIHPTGVTEYETVFEIENHGRGSVALSPPATLIPRGVAVDGVPTPASRVAETGALVVDLPAGRRFVRLAVRSEADIRPGRAGWRVPLATTGIDVPVLERTWQVLVPDGVDLVGASPGLREVVADVPGWVERLLTVSVRRRGTSPQAGAAAPRRGTIDAGFRARTFVLPSGGVAAPSVLLVRSRWTWAATLLVCLGAATFGLSVRRRLTRLAVAVALAVLALWLPGPLDGLARAGLWGLAAAALVRFGAGRWPRLLPVILAALVASPAAAQAPQAAGDARPAPESLPVFIVPGAGNDGEASSTALVPEPLYRALAIAAGRRAGAGVRFLAARLEAAPGTDLPWKLVVDVEATGESLLSLAQTGDATWGTPGPIVDGVAVRPSPDSGPRIVRVGFPGPGRHRVELPLAVEPRREGDVATATVELPVTPHTDVVVEGALEPARGAPTLVQVERLDAGGRPRALAMAARDTAPATVFDASRAALVRLTWAADGRTPLADAVPAVESRNVIGWRDGAGRLDASFRVDGRGQIVRGVVVRADGRLGPITLADPSLSATPLPGGRFLIAPLAPRRGGFRVDASFALSPDDPVGAGELPGAWIESAVSDARSVRVEVPPELMVRVTPPDDALRVTQQAAAAGSAGGEQSFEWRLERGGGARQVDVDDAGAAVGPAVARAGADGNGRIVVERRRVPPRGSQRVDVELGRDQSRVALEARIDAAGLPLVVVPIEVPPGCDVERARLREERGGAAPAEEVVVRWHRAAPDRLLAVVQRPRAGIFTLGLVAVLPGAAPATGTLPLARTLLEHAGPSTVTWTAPPATILEVVSADGGAGDPSRRPSASGSIEVPADGAGPAYRLLEAEAEHPGEAPSDAVADGEAVAEPPAAEDGATEPRVELAETHLAIDGRGRAWGVTRFDVVAADPVVRLRMPAGMRPYEVFVDGRVANDALPIRADGAAEGAWEVRLLDARWPRSIAVVWAGDVGEGLPVGGTLAIDTPEVVGLPCRQRAWVLELPEGVGGVPLAPALAADEAGLRDRRSAAMERLVPGFAAAVARASPADAARYEDFVAERRGAVTLPLPAAFGQSGTRRGERAAAWAPPVTILASGDDAAGLRVRLSRRPDPSVAGRGWATVALAAGFVALLEARRRTRWFARLTAALVATWWVGPALSILAGLLWTATLDPAWPGWIALALGAAALAAWAPRARGVGEGRPRTPDGEATTHSVPADASAAAEARREGQAGASGSTVIHRD